MKRLSYIEDARCLKVKVFVRNDAVLTFCFVRFNFSTVVLFDDSGHRECDAVTLG